MCLLGTADSGYRSVSGTATATVNQQNSVASKCGSCGTMRCQCSLQSDPARLSSSGMFILFSCFFSARGRGKGASVSFGLWPPTPNFLNMLYKFEYS